MLHASVYIALFQGDLMRVCRETSETRSKFSKLGLGAREAAQLRVPSVGHLIKMQTLVPQVWSGA